MIVLHPPTPGRPVVHVAADVDPIAGELVAAAIARTVRRHGRCRLGLSGGGTPRGTYAFLREHLPASTYAQLQVTWVDERHLPVAEGARPGDWQAFAEDSNLRLAYDAWLGHVPLAAERVLPLSLGGPIAQEVVRFGRQFLADFDGGLDVAVLGVGPDGHIASLFPDHPGLEVDDVCLAVHDSPKPPAERITLALPVLRRCPCIILVATGGKKADVLLRAWRGDAALPLARLRPEAGARPQPDQHWVLDGAAAAGIVAAAQAEIGGL